MMRQGLLCLVMLWPLNAISDEDLSLVFDVGIKTDDNVTRAAAGRDVREDTSTEVNVDLAWARPWGANAMLVLRGGLGLARFSEFDGLNNSKVSAAVDYNFRFSRGFTAPTFTLTASLAEEDFDSDMRDATATAFEATMAKRITDEMSGIVGLALESRESESDSFDTEQTRLFANVDWQINARLLAYLTWQQVNGDIVSSATPTFEIVDRAETIEADDAFSSTSTTRFAYRLDADTTLLTLGTNYAIDPDSTIDASLELLDSDAGGIHYDRSVLRVSYLVAF